MATASALPTVRLAFSQAPALPDPVGFAGLAGGKISVGGDCGMLVVGGAHFPDKKPWEGGLKVYNKSAYLFTKGAWSIAGELPEVMAYAAYAGTPSGLIVAGGTNDKENFRKTFRVSPAASGVKIEALPDLPAPVAFAACATLNGKLYVVGGTDSPTATTALNSVYALDLAKPEAGWKTLAPIPGVGRHLSVAGDFGGLLYVFGGCSLAPKDGKPFRTYLTQALVYNPSADTWTTTTALPESLVASVGPAPVLGDALVLLGGDTGFFYNNGKSPAEHPGQPKTVYAFTPATGTYVKAGELPVGIVTAPAIECCGKVFLVSGETGPGKRTNTVTVVERV